MITSKVEKIRFIYEYFEENGIKDDKEIKNVESTPLMIRNNGLFNTLMYLKVKGGYEIFSIYYTKILNGGDLLPDILNKYKQLDQDYLAYTYEFYRFACQLKMYFKTV